MSDRLTQLKSLLEADPNDPFCLYGLAQEYAKAGDHAQAIEFYDRTIAADKTYCYAWFHKARSQEALDQMDEAASTLREGLDAAKACGDAQAIGEISGYLDSIT